MINVLRKYYLCNIGIILAGILLISSCSNSSEDINALTARNNRREDHATDVTFIYSKDGKIKMRAFAHDFVRNESANPPYINMNRKLKAEFFDDSGKVEHVLTADSCRYYTIKGDVIVWDSVQVVSRKGEQLNTDELVWNAGIQKFFTEKPVKITTPTEVLFGNGMEANSDFSWYRIIDPKGTVAVNKSEMPQ